MTNDNYIGITTGTVATACSLAALDAIIESPDIACVKVETPKKTLDIIIDECKLISSFKAQATAHKNPYSDPDVTVNLDIIATVELLDKTSQESNVIITGGEGVGKVTKPGLQIPIGDYAINPVPRRMIIKNLKDKVPKGKIAKVTITIPEGEEIAKKTMNPKLGIIGGISVLGTTGIARSMSSDAYKNSIVKQIDVALASNVGELVFVPGNIGEKLALKKLEVNEDQIIQTGNYVGFMFEEAEKRGITLGKPSQRCKLVSHAITSALGFTPFSFAIVRINSSRLPPSYSAGKRSGFSYAPLQRQAYETSGMFLSHKKRRRSRFVTSLYAYVGATPNLGHR